MRRAALAALRAKTSAPCRFVWPDPVRSSDGLDVHAWITALGAAPSAEAQATILPRELGDDFADALARHRDLQLRALDDLDARPDGIAAGPLSAGALSPADRAALDELGQRLVPVLRKLAASADPAVAARAAEVLVKVSDADAALAEAASSPRLEVRLAVLQALSGRPARPPALPATPTAPPLKATLERALGATDWRERRAAALALVSSPDAEHLRSLGAALDDPNGFVREAAARSLDRLAHDPDPQVRAGAAAALNGHHAHDN